MRVLGLDYGSKTVGVAVSDPLGLTAQGVETVWRKQENKLRRTLARIEETGVHKEDRKQYLDQVAAVFILQGYLDAAAYRREQQEGVEE